MMLMAPYRAVRQKCAKCLKFQYVVSGPTELVELVARPRTIESKRTAPPGPSCFGGLGHASRRATPVLDTVGTPDSHGRMRSQLADAARRRLNEDVSRMTAEERLGAFLAHCQLIAQLARAGASVQRQPRNTVPRNAR